MTDKPTNVKASAGDSDSRVGGEDGVRAGDSDSRVGGEDDARKLVNDQPRSA